MRLLGRLGEFLIIIVRVAGVAISRHRLVILILKLLQCEFSHCLASYLECAATQK